MFLLLKIRNFRHIKNEWTLASIAGLLNLMCGSPNTSVADNVSPLFYLS